jgi:hypothetical protein
MKFLTFFFLLPIIVSAQQAEVVLSLPECNRLYRFYPNNLAFGSIEGNLEYDIVVEGGTFEPLTRPIKSRDPYQMETDEDSVIYNPYTVEYEVPFYLVENSGRLTPYSCEVKLIFLKKNTSDTINTVDLDVYPLPDPSVYLGGKSDGESVNKNVTSIQVKWGPQINLTGVTFPISGWILSSLGKEVSGVGSYLNAAASELMKVSSGEYVTLVVNYKNPDKTISRRSSTFKVH